MKKQLKKIINYILDEKNQSNIEKTLNQRLKSYNQIWNKVKK